MAQSFLKMNRVSLTYFGEYVGLNNITFDSASQNKMVFWGGKFDGKSSLLKALAGTEKLCGGEVEFCGQNLLEVDKKNRNFAFTFDENSIFLNKTARENIAFPLKLRGFKKEEIICRVDNIATQFEMTKILDEKCVRFSNYQKSMLLLARAFVRECKLYLIDNVFATLATDERAKAFATLCNFLKCNNLPVVICTDNFEEAQTLNLIFKSTDCAVDNKDNERLEENKIATKKSLVAKMGFLNNCNLVEFDCPERAMQTLRHIQVEKCFFGENKEAEVGRLIKCGEDYFVETSGEKLVSVPPIDDNYEQKEVVFLKNINGTTKVIEHYYDLSSEIRVSKLQ